MVEVLDRPQQAPSVVVGVAGLPPVMRAAIADAITAGLRSLEARPRQPLAVWAAEHFQMDEESSHKRGRWEPWPFQVGMMNWMSCDDIEELDVQKAKRTGYTKSITALGAYCAAHTRRKYGLWQPTDDDRDSYVKSEVQPAYDICKALGPVRRSGVDNDTIKFKRFRGSVQHYLGAKAARSFRRITLAVAVLDEVDAMEQVVEKTIDPVTGAHGRLEGAPFPKLIIGTTPRIKGLSHIERRVRMADAVMRYHIDCPHCGVDHPLMWGGKDVQHGFKWDGADAKTSPATVRHLCPHCHGSITQADYERLAPAGRWVDQQGRYTYDHTADQWHDAAGMPCRAPRHVAAVNVWTAYSPQRTWADIVREFLEARTSQKAGDNGPMQGFRNETLAELWEEEFEATDAEVLHRRAQREANIPLRVVPAGACKILMGIDTQADRWEATVIAVGRNCERWIIDHRVIYGTPAQQSEWGKHLDPLIATEYHNVHGVRMKIDAVGVDTGGSNWTHQAYNFVRERPHLPLYATKGDPALGADIKMKPSWVDVNARGRIIKRGLKLWRICVDTAKDYLHGVLENVRQPGPGFIHFNPHLDMAWFQQLSAEQRVPVRTVRGREWRWMCPSGVRNEALDCVVICLFLERALGLDSQTDATWSRWESSLVPDLFSQPASDDLQSLADAAGPRPQVEPTQQPAVPAPATPTPATLPPPRSTSLLVSDEWSSRL